MKERNLSSDLTTAVISVFLSVFLIILTVVFALSESVQNLISPAGVTDIVRNVGYDNLTEEIPALEKSFRKYGFTGVRGEEFLDSRAVEGICGLYSKDITSAMKLDTESDEQFTAENIQKEMILDLSGLVSILTDGSDDQEERLESEEGIIAGIKEVNSDIFKEIPLKEDLMKSVEDSGISWVTGIIADSGSNIVLLIFILVLSIGIYTLRVYCRGGLIWLGVDFIISGFFTVLLSVLAATGLADYMLSGIFDFDTFFDSAVSVFVKYMIISGSLMFIAAVVSFVVFAGLKKSKNSPKKKNVKSNRRQTVYYR